MAEVGTEVWVRTRGADAWAAGVVSARSDADITVRLTSGEETSVPAAREREGAELVNVKIRDGGDYARFDTKGRGGVDDLIQLTHLHEPAILDVLSIRYANDCIYTYTGPILLAVNPFQRLKLYTTEILEEYHMHGVLRSSNMQPAPLQPHVYAVADTAYRCMMDDGAQRTVDNRNQSMLVSGESGAGKTETTKIIMQYLATVGRPKETINRGGMTSRMHRAPSADAFSSGGDPPADMAEAIDGALASLAVTSPRAATSGIARASVEERVLKSNPILEAFGNAKTSRNENSSRFGKYITMQFNSRGELVGASIETYLLEKVRLVTQNAGERNYHVFYQMCKGASSEERARWRLGAPEEFHFLNQSGCTTLREADDAEEYHSTRAAMDTMGFARDDQDGLFDALAGVLHLGNGKFVDVSAASSGAAPAKAAAAAKGGKGASAAGSGPEARFDPAVVDQMKIACELLGLEFDGLQTALTSKEITAGTEKYTTHFNAAQANAALEAVTKALYGRLFLWVVAAVNKQIRAPPAIVANFIGVLDIFGFEHFENNSFEQLCINYANETLQQQFNQFVFKLEQAEYTREGISFSVGDFPDNQDCLDLIEARKPAGILALLDEQCLLPTATDSGYARKLHDAFKDNARFSATSKQKAAAQFTIRHYAGEVTYSTNGFIDKNRDAIHAEAVEVFTLSRARMTRTFFTPETWNQSSDAPASATTAGGADLDVAAVLAAATSALTGDAGRGGKHVADPAATHSRARDAPAAKSSGAAAPKGATGSATRGGGLMSDTVGSQFKSQLLSLITVIRATTPHYVRCVKPNGRQLPREFERASVVSQLRCGGVLEAVRVARLGYPVRKPHADVMTMYTFLAPPTARASIREARTHSAKKAAEMLMSLLALPDGTVQIGLSKVFFRRAAFDELESRLQKARRAAAIKLQAIARGRMARKRYTTTRALVLKIQSLVRGHAARLRVTQMRRLAASIRLQAFSRCAIARTRFTRFRGAVLRMQSRLRGARARARVLQMKRELTATRVQAMWRMHVSARIYTRMRAAAITLQCWVRQRHAVALLQRYKREAREVGNLREDNIALRAKVRTFEAELASWQALVASLSRGLITSLDDAHVRAAMARLDIRVDGAAAVPVDNLLHEMQQVAREDASAGSSHASAAVSGEAGDASATTALEAPAATKIIPETGVESAAAALELDARPAERSEDAAVATRKAATPAAPVAEAAVLPMVADAVSASAASRAPARRATVAMCDSAVQTDAVTVAPADAHVSVTHATPARVAATVEADDIYKDPGDDDVHAHTPARPVVAAPAHATPSVYLSEVATLKAKLADAEKRAIAAENKLNGMIEEMTGRTRSASTTAEAADASGANAGSHTHAPASDMTEFTRRRTQKLEAQVARAESKAIQLEKRIAVAEKAAADAAAAKLAVEADRATLRRENERMRTTIEELQNSTVAAYQKQADALTIRSTELEERVVAQEKQLKEAHAAYEQAEFRYRTADARRVDAEDERNALKEKVATDKQMLYQITRLLDAASVEAKEARMENEALQKTLVSVQQENKMVRNQAQRLSEALANLQSQRNVVGAGKPIPEDAKRTVAPVDGSGRRRSSYSQSDVHDVPLTGSAKQGDVHASISPDLDSGMVPVAFTAARDAAAASAVAAGAARRAPAPNPHAGPPVTAARPPAAAAPAPKPQASGSSWIGAMFGVPK